ncbi:hypothetical protein [Streptomyces spiramenti]|uniref:DUF998 domain-containing protein n=1 Tax=Streptomyces spiramenti TaxID=2720606 RepID=A0ABX1APT2_9ACTN|nr:hypothetical protein [Streptomyces spiramenti]NJP67641.1 hypothetical protein [Streptomyces spiramenti]
MAATHRLGDRNGGEGGARDAARCGRRGVRPSAADGVVLHRPLLALVGLMVLLAVVALVGTLVDGRTVNGEPAWLKPLKFAVSFGVYGATAVWLLSLLPAGPRGRPAGQRTGTVLAVASIIEVGLITMQAARGSRSHFNGSTAFDSHVFAAMAGAAAVIWLSSLGITLLVLRHRLPDRTLGLALRAGMTIAVAAMAVAFLMTTGDQRDPAAGVLGAHAVGVADGGDGLPVVGWSVEGGDLRVPHFLGMHALQLLPLLLWAVDRGAPRWRRLAGPGVRHGLVRAGAVACGGALVLVTWQALRGRPLLAPDPAGWAGVALLVLVAAGLVARALRRGGAAGAGPAAADGGPMAGARSEEPGAGSAAGGAPSAPGRARG